MDGSNLFQLGIGLETGAHAEETRVPSDTQRDVLDDTRDAHVTRRDGTVLAGTHLIIAVV